MRESDDPRVAIGNNEGLQVTTAFSRAVMEIRSVLPEHKSGEKAPNLDGRELPREVGATLLGSLRILCLAPGEWLLISAEHSASSINERIAARLAAQGAVLIDVTGGLGTLSIRGPLARDVLSKSCGLDLHPNEFPVGRCARTRFAQMSVILDHVDDAPSFRSYVARSHLRFLADWVEDAAVEFNVISQ